MVKCKTGDREVPGSIPGRCNSLVCFCCFFCFFYFSVLFFSFFDKKTESKGIHMLLDNFPSLKVVKNAVSVTLTIVVNDS